MDGNAPPTSEDPERTRQAEESVSQSPEPLPKHAKRATDFSADEVRKFVAFQVAEEAKSYVKKWAGQALAVVLTVAAVLGITTYLDIHGKIDAAAETQLKAAQARIDSAVVNLEAEIESIRSRVSASGEAAEAEILRAVTQVTDRPATRTVARQSRIRPISPGVSIGSTATPAITACCLFQDRAGQQYVVTASFIVNVATEPNPQVRQPGMMDGGTAEDVIGTVTQAGQYAAAVRLSDRIQAVADIPEIGYLTGTAAAQVGNTVRKYGRTTGLTEGVVTALGVEFGFQLWGESLAVKAFRVDPISGTWASGGDAGAAVVNARNELVGIVFAGTSDYGLVLPSADLAEDLSGLSVVTGPPR